MQINVLFDFIYLLTERSIAKKARVETSRLICILTESRLICLSINKPPDDSFNRDEIAIMVAQFTPHPFQFEIK